MAGRNNLMLKRMQRELQMFSTSPPPGIAVWPRAEDRVDVLDAEIRGAEGTPYENGIFRLDVGIPPEYPIQPPRVKFVTPIYHPNIDSAGRVCLDTLNMPPKGAWKPSLNISTVLASIQLLMSEPNADDGLMVDITEEYKTRKDVFESKARSWTAKHARGELSNRARSRVNESDNLLADTAVREEHSNVGGTQTELLASPSSVQDDKQSSAENVEEDICENTKPRGSGKQKGKEYGQSLNRDAYTTRSTRLGKRNAQRHNKGPEMNKLKRRRSGRATRT